MVSPRRGTVWRQVRRRWLGALGLAVTAVVSSPAAVLAPWLAQYDPKAQALGDALERPRAGHCFGNDELRRDCCPATCTAVACRC